MESAPFILMLNTIKWLAFWRVHSKVIVDWRSSVNISMPFIMKDSLEGIPWFSWYCIKPAFLKKIACYGNSLLSLFWKQSFCYLWCGGANSWPDVGHLSCMTTLDLCYSLCIHDDAFPPLCLSSLQVFFDLVCFK